MKFYVKVSNVFFNQIPVVADLPVGKNLQDHVMTLLEFHDNTTRVATKPKLASPMNILKYLLFGTGNSLSIVLI